MPPPPLYAEMSVAAQTAFANLEQAARQRDVERSITDISGSFARKTVKNSVYWYYQTKDPDGRPQQAYLGPDSEFIQDLVAKRKSRTASAGDAHLARLSAAAIALGCVGIPPKHGRVIRRIAEYGFFRAGGVLAGTHAFLAFQNYLGATWREAVTTMDLDFAHAGNNLSIAMPNQHPVDIRSAIESLQMGFLPVHGQARFKKADEPDFDVDFLTVLTRVGDEPIEVKSLGVSLQPLKFMELAFERPVQTALLLNDGPLVVNVPQPAYYALHKLIVHVERRRQNPSKSAKDLVQSGALIEYLLDHRPGELHDAYADVLSRGPGWKSRIEAGLGDLRKSMPALQARERLAQSAPGKSLRARKPLPRTRG